MADFTELMSNQVFNEDVNGFEERKGERIGPGRSAQYLKTGADVQPNGDVIFRIIAPEAQSVKIDFRGTHIRTEKGVVLDMVKGENGIWEYTLPYDPHDVGPRDFTFIIDGATMISPYLPVYQRTNRINNYVEIPDPDFTLHHIRRVPHGSIVYRTYWSEAYGRFMRCLVYLPADYNHNTDRLYPTVYLNNGGSENETTWINASKVHYIMDNLIAEGRAVPMILVMTNTMAFRDGEAEKELLFGWHDMILGDTIPFIESEYRVYRDKWNRAICGDSFGGVAAGFMGWQHPDTFGNIGFFAAPIRYDNIWKTYEENKHMHWMVDNAEEVGRQYRILFFSRGEAEYLTNFILQMDDDWLSRNGILALPCTHMRLYGGDFTHDHSTFRRGFADFVQLLFKDEPRPLGAHKPDPRAKMPDPVMKDQLKAAEDKSQQKTGGQASK